MIRAVRIPSSPLYKLHSTSWSNTLLWAAKSTPGMAFKDEHRGWCGYPDAIEVASKMLAEKGVACDTSALPPPGQPAELAFPFVTKTAFGELRPYQLDGVRFLIANADSGALLADGMRLGKSPQALIAARYFKQKTLIVCPANVRDVWAAPSEPSDPGGEIARWWPQQKGAIYCPEGVKETEAIPDSVQIVVIHYDILYAWVERLLEWGFRTLIVDECHMISGHESRRTKALQQLARHAPRRMFLSGTPMTNRPMDLHPVVETLCPGRFGYFFVRPADPEERKQRMTGFSQRYCNAHQVAHGKGPDAESHWDFKGHSNEEELARRLSYFMLRRVKSEVDDQLPPKTRRLVPVPVPSKYAVKPTSGMFTDHRMARRALDLAADGKFKPVVDLLKTHVEEGEKVICFTHRKTFTEAVVNALATKGIKAHFINGDVTQPSRTRLIKECRSSDEPLVLACTIDTCSVGIDFSFASVAVFAELTWEDWELEQAEERLYRVGSGQKALIEYVIAKGTGDELIASAIVSKIGLKKRVIGKAGDNLDADLRADRSKGLSRLAQALREKQARLAAEADT